MIAALLLLLAPADDAVTITGYRWAPFISPMGEPFLAKSVGEDTLATWFGQADADRDGRLTEAEMRADAARFFAALDQDETGALEPDDIVYYETAIAPDVQVGKKRRPRPGEPCPRAARAATDFRAPPATLSSISPSPSPPRTPTSTAS